MGDHSLGIDQRPAFLKHVKLREMSGSNAKAIWRNIAVSGLVLTLIGMGAIGLSVAHSSRWNILFLDHHLWAAVMLATLIGVATLSVGLIGWAVLLGKLGRENLTIFAGCFPFCVMLIGMFLGRRDPHGTYMLFFIPMFPLFVVALILGMMSTFARRT